MTNEQHNLDTFLNLSTVITGFSKMDLLGTGLVFAYYETVTERAGATASEQLWTAWSDISQAIKQAPSESDEIIRIRLMSNPKFGPVARCIIKLWYLGQWEALPPHWRSIYGNHFGDVDIIISGDSYKEGLVWPAIGAHPMGAKQPGFDTWSSPPVNPSSVE